MGYFICNFQVNKSLRFIPCISRAQFHYRSRNSVPLIAKKLTLEPEAKDFASNFETRDSDDKQEK